MNKLTLTNILLLVFSILIVIAILFQPEASARIGRTLNKTVGSNFYTPPLQIMKAYSLNPASTHLDQILTQDIQGINANFGIYIKNLSTHQTATLNSTDQFDPASLYKLFIMYTIYHKSAEGQLNLNDPIITDNLNQMITVSDNDAAYYLVNNYTSWPEITEQVRQIGLTNTDLDQNPPLTTPADVGNLLEQIARGKAVNFDSSVQMLSLMTRQTRRDRIPEPLPSDKTLVANKTGELDDLLHDAAIVGTAKSDYVIVLMSKDSADLNQTRVVEQKISEDVYNYFQN